MKEIGASWWGTNVLMAVYIVRDPERVNSGKDMVRYI